MNSLERRAAQLRDILHSQPVLIAMAEPREEQGHQYENCCSAWFEIYQACKWCGERR